MVSRRYSGYLADDESLRGARARSLDSSPRRETCDWRNLLRPPSQCPFRHRDASSPASACSASSAARKKQKVCEDGTEEGNRLSDEFSEFVDFLADEDVLDSLQRIMEDAVRKLREVTTESGEHLFDVQEDSDSSPESESWSFTYSHSSTQSRVRYQTSMSSSSEDDWEDQLQGAAPPGHKVCLLDKYAARLPRLDPRPVEEMSGGFHAEVFQRSP